MLGIGVTSCLLDACLSSSTKECLCSLLFYDSFFCDHFATALRGITCLNRVICGCRNFIGECPSQWDLSLEIGKGGAERGHGNKLAQDGVQQVVQHAPPNVAAPSARCESNYVSWIGHAGSCHGS
jgi:hypothetical protein